MTEKNKVILDTDKLPNFADTFIDINTYKRLEQENFVLTQESQQKSQTICELEQENKEFETLVKSLYKRIEELEKENEALVFRERLYKADYEASEQENKELKEKLDKEEYNSCCECTNIQNQNDEYRSALEEINITVKQLLQGVSSNCINNTPYLTALSLIENKINEVLRCE